MRGFQVAFWGLLAVFWTVVFFLVLFDVVVFDLEEVRTAAFLALALVAWEIFTGYLR